MARSRNRWSATRLEAARHRHAARHRAARARGPAILPVPESERRCRAGSRASLTDSAPRSARLPACAATSGAEKIGHARWIGRSSVSFAGFVAAAGKVALVELVAAVLAFRL